jgi:PncC family amidohydrolase
MVATAESCTGGLIGHLLTEIPGSSAYVAGGAITYSNAAKARVLGVPHELLLRVGAVSAEVAQAMAQGARALYAADIAVAVTGIAGPGGGLPHKPTGSVYLHVSGPDGWERGEYHVWPFDRSGNKLQSAVRGLEMIAECAEHR